MLSSWVGVCACLLVIYFGIVHSASHPLILLNGHALILVIGGTVAIGLLTYRMSRLLEVVDFVLFGFLFRAKSKEAIVASDIVCQIDAYFGAPSDRALSRKPHPFLGDVFRLLRSPELDYENLQRRLTDQRNAVKRRYVEDAKILNNLAKYPPHLGLLGAASGMIEMMSGLGGGTAGIGNAMAVALSATLWGVGMNNFVFLPLADNASKAADDEMYLRDIMIECALLIKQGGSHEQVARVCLDRISQLDRVAVGFRSAKRATVMRRPERFDHAA